MSDARTTIHTNGATIHVAGIGDGDDMEDGKSYTPADSVAVPFELGSPVIDGIGSNVPPIADVVNACGSTVSTIDVEIGWVRFETTTGRSLTGRQESGGAVGDGDRTRGCRSC